MATIKEMLETEHKRDRQDVIHLFGEGTFWRAYEQSAWLCVRSVNEFKVTKRQLKGIDSPVTFIGFPQTSLDKWFAAPFEILQREEKHVVVAVPAEKLPEADLQTYPQLFALWKDNLPLAPEAKPVASTDGKGGKKVRTPEVSVPFEEQGGEIRCLTDVMKAILAFPVESRSPIDSMLFLAEMKRHLAKIL